MQIKINYRSGETTVKMTETERRQFLSSQAAVETVREAIRQMTRETKETR